MSDYNEKENIVNSDENNNLPLDEQGGEQKSPEKKRVPRRISLQSCVISVISLVIAAIMMTYTVCNSMYKERLNQTLAGISTQGSYDGYDKLDLIRKLFEKYSYLEVEDEAILDAVIQAYVKETGDRYAVYYNEEEYAAYLTGAAGTTVSIGAVLTPEVIEVDGVEYLTLSVIEIDRDGPAQEAGIMLGDKIAWIGPEGAGALVGNMTSYDEALNLLQGEEGTYAEFTAFRFTENGYEKLFFSVERKNVDVQSVIGRASKTDPKVGIVRIERFKYNTPAQFVSAVDALILAGCENIVFDVRGNLGGSLDSVIAMLSYFLPAGSTILSTVDGNGNTETTLVQEITSLEGDLADCNVFAEDIGKYRNSFKNIAVLCNSMSASAAELFAAALRDHGLALLVGTKTYGKGSVQSVISLAPYGFSGGLRLTTRMYFPPCGENYDGIGIYPNENYNIELSEEALQYSIDSLPEELDNQLLAALGSFK